MTPSRPAEGTQAIVSAIIGAVVIIYGAFKNGFHFESLSNPEVLGAIMVLVGFVASAITWYVGRQQRAGALKSAVDGTVKESVQ